MTIFQPDMKKHFPESEVTLHRFLDRDGAYRVLALDSPALGQSLADAHDLSGDFRTLFIQGVHAAALMSADLKQTMKLILQIKWETGGFSLEADWNGNIRGYVRDPEVIESRFHSEEVLGGTLAIIRMIGANPGYTGYGSIFGFNLASALQSHFASSEQMDSLFHFDGERSLMIQRLPPEGGNPAGSRESENPADLQAVIGALLPRLDELFSSDDQSLPGGFGLTRLSAEQRRIHCTCDRQKISAYIQGLDRGELLSMYDEGPWPVVVNCDNCSSSYEFSRDDIGAMLSSRGL
jgi:molecular chaperone Hsp33